MSRYSKLAAAPRGIVAATAVAAMVAGAQAREAGADPAGAAAAAELARGDSAYARRDVRTARVHYLRAIAASPRHYEALWKASRAEVDIAESAGGGAARDSLIEAARAHAERAIGVQPGDVEGHFALARALGRKALAVGVMDRIRLSKLIYAEAQAALAADSTHAGALHVLGMWHAEVMRVNGMARAFARTFLGAQLFGRASWDEAQRLLEASVRRDPDRIVHKLDLAGILHDRGQTARARELYEQVAAAPVIEPNDDLYKRQAAQRLTRP